MKRLVGDLWTDLLWLRLWSIEQRSLLHEACVTLRGLYDISIEHIEPLNPNQDYDFGSDGGKTSLSQIRWCWSLGGALGHMQNKMRRIFRGFRAS